MRTLALASSIATGPEPTVSMMIGCCCAARRTRLSRVMQLFHHHNDRVADEATI